MFTEERGNKTLKLNKHFIHNERIQQKIKNNIIKDKQTWIKYISCSVTVCKNSLK